MIVKRGGPHEFRYLSLKRLAGKLCVLEFRISSAKPQTTKYDEALRQSPLPSCPSEPCRLAGPHASPALLQPAQFTALQPLPFQATPTPLLVSCFLSMRGCRAVVRSCLHWPPAATAATERNNPRGSIVCLKSGLHSWSAAASEL